MSGDLEVVGEELAADVDAFGGVRQARLIEERHHVRERVP